MIHFTFELEAVALDGHPANLRGFSPQDDLELIELPLIRCEGEVNCDLHQGNMSVSTLRAAH